jgi:hypothetical protein
MLALILFAAAAVAIGAAVPRWWVVPLPLIIAAAWVLYAAAVGGEDRDGMPVWQLAAFFGGWLAGAGMLGLVLGVVLGRWARDRRIERSQRFSL